MSGSWASNEGTRRAMQANRSRDTVPELAVRRILHARGLRYRVDVRPIPSLRRKADIVFTRVKIAVFIDGGFWHGCDEHFVSPRANAEYWDQKIKRNRTRDAETTDLLRSEGWTVLRYWEHQPAVEVATEVIATVRPSSATA